jgi:hypothetical protein
MTMEYAVELSLQGGSGLQPIAGRVLMDLGEIRDGPGEEEMERVAAALAPVLSLLLDQLKNLHASAALSMKMTGDAAHISLDLRYTAEGDDPQAIPAALIDPLLPALRQTFDQIEGPEADGKAASYLVLTRHHAS